MRYKRSQRQNAVVHKLELFNLAVNHFMGSYAFNEEELAQMERAAEQLFELSQSMDETRHRTRCDTEVYGANTRQGGK